MGKLAGTSWPERTERNARAFFRQWRAAFWQM